MTKYLLELFKLGRRRFDESQLTKLEKEAIESSQIQLPGDEPTTLASGDAKRLAFEGFIRGQWGDWRDLPYLPPDAEYQALELKVGETARKGAIHFAEKNAKVDRITDLRISKIKHINVIDKNLVVKDDLARGIGRILGGYEVEYRTKPIISFKVEMVYHTK